jgi:hypothetical protein
LSKPKLTKSFRADKEEKKNPRRRSLVANYLLVVDE